MTSLIRPNRLEVSDRFPVLGFTVHTDKSPAWFEVVVASNPALFRADQKAQRTSSNFFSSRASGLLQAEHGEAVYLVPSEVLNRFIGQEKLYYALATYIDTTRNQATIDQIPTESSPWINITMLTGRSLRRPNSVLGNRIGGNGATLTWAGDDARPGMEAIGSPQSPPAVTAPAPQITTNGNSKPGQSEQPVAAQAGYATGLDYDDGFDPTLWSAVQDDEVASSDDGDGIEEPIPDQEPLELSAGLAASRMLATTAQYPQANRFVAAASVNYRSPSKPRTISRIVIHITDSGSNISSPISWFQNPNQRNKEGKPIHVSAHYVIGQDGEIVQMVRHEDIAWHAKGANSDSIGIEHVANPRGLLPTEAQYCASAALVRWLCDQYAVPIDRTHILGHSEASPGTDHKPCPNSVWDWDYFMGMVTSASCYPRQAMSQGLGKNGTSRAMSFNRYAPAPVRPLVYNIIKPSYTPSDPQEALRFIKDWQQRRERWRAGVPDTSFFPHSAICRFHIYDNQEQEYCGTGFYIGQNTILTCAHNVSDAQSITVIPGKNDSADNPEPFGSFSVNADAWTIHPQYTASSRAYDLAVIQVSTPAPNGRFFNILEELNQSLDSPIIVCGYAAESVSSNRQHLDGDMIRTLGSDNQTFQYNLQTEGGSSGSPVFYVWGREDQELQQSVLETRIIGVHTSIAIDPTTGTYSDELNEGCRLTNAKIDWIYSVAGHSAFPLSLGMRNGASHRSLRQVKLPRPLENELIYDVKLVPHMLDSVERMRIEFVTNAASGIAKRNCITIMNAGLRQLYGSRLQDSNGANRSLGSTVQASMAALQGYGLAQPEMIFEFNDASGSLTKGFARPDSLSDSIEAWILSQAEANTASASYCFGLSLLDGYHSVVLVLSFSGTSDPRTKIYWCDQIYTGWDDVTGNLDSRITQLSQRWWDSSAANKKPRTRVTLWPLMP